MSDEFPWPRPGDTLFTNEGDWSTATVGWTRDHWFLYIEGYKRAADVLVQHVIDSRSDQDFLVYPIGFLYRQAIEVSLKYLFREGCQLLEREPEPFKGHKLTKLWPECREILEEVWPDGPRENLDAVEAVLQEFESEDQFATAFRYPTDRKGNASFPDRRRINLRNFSEVAGRSLSLLEGATTAMVEFCQVKWEMEDY